MVVGFIKGVNVLCENCDVIAGLMHFCGLGRVLKFILDCKLIWWLLGGFVLFGFVSL